MKSFPVYLNSRYQESVGNLEIDQKAINLLQNFEIVTLELKYVTDNGRKQILVVNIKTDKK